MDKRIAVVAVVLGGLSAIVAGFVALEPLKHEATSFEVLLGCSPDAISTDTQSKSPAPKWEANVLAIRVSEIAYCSDSLRQVAAQVVGPLVLLHLKFDSPRPPTACACEHRYMVRMSNLPQRNYKIISITSETKIALALPGR